jgi:hypothetical protein
MGWTPRPLSELLTAAIQKNIPASKAQEIRFEKLIYNYKNKTAGQIYDNLKLETDSLLSQNPGFRIQRFSNPGMRPDGSAVYIIFLTPETF